MMSPGTKLGGRYRLDERIATGGMGDVWYATDEVLGRQVAVKVLLPSLLNEPGFIERFRGEARVVATLTDPNIVRVYDYGESPMDGGGQVAYLVMEFISGEALTARLQKMGRLPVEEALPIIAQAAEALDTAHRHGIIHRDVKPGNLLITPKGTVMLTDFGIARSALTGGLTQAGSVLGTAAYISPEQAVGHAVTGQSDVYSLGIVAYQCLAGRRPFDSDNPVELAMRHVNDEPPPLPDDVPEAARQFVATALAKDLSQRFPSGQAMAEAARQAQAGGTTPMSQPPPPGGEGGQARGAAVPPPGRGMDNTATSIAPPVNPETPASAQRRNKRLLFIAAAALVLVLVAGGVWAIVGSGGSGGAIADGDDTTSEGSGDGGEEDENSAQIDAAEYINQSPQDVEAALTEAGFTDVTVNGVGRFVSEVTPDGEQPLDTAITIKTSPTRVPEDGQSGQPSDEPSQPGQSGDPGNSDDDCNPVTIGCRTK